MIGKRIGDYQIIEKLGAGSMGTVYKALQSNLNREVALKILAPRFTFDKEFVERFAIEAKAVASLVHQNILQMYSKGTTDGGQHYFAMEYIEGEDLESKAKKGVKFSEEEVIDIIIQACRGLESAHKKNYIHRDIKPSNIIITENDGTVKITDFGLAKSLVTTSKLTRANVYMGTVHYTSPEQGEGSSSVDHRSDIYSLGIVLYELLTNKLPFEGASAQAVIIQHITKSPIRPRKIAPGISSRIEAVVLKAIAKKPINRYQDMTAFRNDLEAVKQKLFGKKEITPGEGEKKAKTKSIIIWSVPLLLIIGCVVWYTQLHPWVMDKNAVSIIGNIPNPKGEEELKYDEIMKHIFEATGPSEKSKIEDEVKEFQKKYPGEYGKYKGPIENGVNALSKNISSFNEIAEDIEFSKTISALDGIEKKIIKSKNRYSKFKSIYSVLNYLWEKKWTKLNYEAFTIGRGEIENAKTEEEVNKSYLGFKEKYPLSEYLDTLKGIKITQLEDIKNIKEAQIKIYTAFDKQDESEIRKTRDKYLKILKSYKYQNILGDFARDKLSIIKKTDEENVFKNTKQNIANAKAEDKVNNYILDFQEKYPHSKYLFILEDLKRRKFDQLKDVEKLKEAQGKISLAFEERNVNEIRDVMDEYLESLKLPENINTLKVFAGEKINIMVKGSENSAFMVAESGIENAKTENEANNIFLVFKNKYTGSEYSKTLEGLKNRRIAQFKDIEKLKEAEIKILTAFDKHDIVKIRDIRNEYLKILKSSEKKNSLENFAVDLINKITIIQANEEEEAYQIAKNNMNNAKTVDEVNNYLLDFKSKYSNVVYLNTLEYRKNQKAAKLEDIKNLKEAEVKILTAFDMRDIKGIRDFRDGYSEILKLSESKKTIERFARVQINIIERGNEEKAFRSAKINIYNSKTKDDASSHFLKFKNRYINSGYLNILEDMKVVRIKEITEEILRAGCTTWIIADVREMVSKRNYFNNILNPTGNYANDFEEEDIDGDDVVIDHATRLMWHKYGSGSMPWEEAREWIERLNNKKYAEYDDWRMPTIEEAASLLETVEGIVKLSELKSKRNKEGEKYKLYINPIFGKKQSRIWTCDSFGTNRAFLVLFDFGNVGQDKVTSENFARPVRSDK